MYYDYDRINMIGKNGSGKTSFLASMYYRMGYDFGKYTVMASMDEDEILARTYWDMNCSKERKWPASSAETYEYHFKLYHSLCELYKYTWIDWSPEDLVQLFEGTNLTTKRLYCKGDWLLFLDGRSFIAEASNKTEYKEKVKEQLELNQDLYFMDELMKYEQPSICVVVTKSDLIKRDVIGGKFFDDQDVEKMVTETIEEIVYETLEPLFISKFSKKVTVLILPVTVGENLDKEEWLNSKNVELPMLFFAAQKMGRAFWSDDIKWRQKELPSLLEMIPDDQNIYVDGVRRNLKEYYRIFLEKGV